MVESKYVKSRKVYKLSFEIPPTQLPDDEVTTLAVVGNFNDWDPTAHLLRRAKGGTYCATLEVEQPGSYHYRYLLNGDSWLNDWHAEGYAPNGYGTENCVVTVSPTE